MTEQRVIDGPLIRSSEARRLDEMAAELQEAYAHHAELTAKDKTYRIAGPIGLVTAVFELGRKGVSLARYKGLGEIDRKSGVEGKSVDGGVNLGGRRSIKKK